jgi:hypothetical protein
MATELFLRKFDMSRMQNSVRIAIIGRSGSGKTVLIEDIMKHKRHIPSGICISGTIEGRKAYAKFMPDTYIYPKYNPDVVKTFLNNQMDKIEQREPNPDAFMIMDDCFHEADTWNKNDEINYIFMNSRNDKVFYIIGMQYMMGLTPALRANIDYVFILRNKIPANRVQLYKYYAGGMFNSLRDFETVLDYFTSDFGCLVVDNKSTSNNIEDQIFWYKAKLHSNFTVGSQGYWDYHNRFYNPVNNKGIGRFEIGAGNKSKKSKKKTETPKKATLKIKKVVAGEDKDRGDIEEDDFEDEDYI